MSAICVFCASSTSIDKSYVELAARVGERIAQDGYTLVSGGGRISMMGAVARAARDGGARTIGVIPRALAEVELADTDCDEMVVVEDMRLRKGEMDRRSDAFLVLPGGLGTLEEFTEIWVARTLDFHAKPLVVLDPDGFYAPLHEFLTALRLREFVRDAALDVVTWCSDVDSAFAALVSTDANPGSDPGEALETQL